MGKFRLNTITAGLIGGIAVPLINFTYQTQSLYKCGQQDPQYLSYQIHAKSLFLGYILCCILVASRYELKIKAMGLTVMGIWSLAAMYLLIRPDVDLCASIVGAKDYDRLVENTGSSRSGNPYFCSSQCPCKLQDQHFLYVCNDVTKDNRTIVERTIYECGEHRQCNHKRTLKIQSCKQFSKKFKNFELMECLEENYNCSGWCLNCNMQSLDNSNKNINQSYLEGWSCGTVRDDYVNGAINQALLLIGEEIVLFVVAILIEHYRPPPANDDQQHKPE